MPATKKSPYRPTDHLFLAQNEQTINAVLDKWKPRNLPEDCFLIHTIPANGRFDGPLFNNRAEDVLSTWDVISTTLIDSKKIINGVDALARGINKRETLMFYEIAFVLAVPPQNILGTFAKDVCFPNHAGRLNSSPAGRVVDKSALFEHIRTGERKRKPDGTQNGFITGGYNQIYSPQEILMRTPSAGHNEVLVIGRSGVNIYKGQPATQKIQVMGIVLSPKNLPSDINNDNAFHRKWRALSDKLESINPGVECRFF